MNKKTERWNLQIIYNGGLDSDLDERVDKAVGFAGSSGYDLGSGERDLNYSFVEKSNAKAAQVRVRKMNETTKLDISEIRDMSDW